MAGSKIEPIGGRQFIAEYPKADGSVAATAPSANNSDAVAANLVPPGQDLDTRDESRKDGVATLVENSHPILQEPHTGQQQIGMNPRRVVREMARRIWPELALATGQESQVAFTEHDRAVSVQVVPESTLLTRDGLDRSRMHAVEQFNNDQRDALWLQSSGLIRPQSKVASGARHF